MKDTISYYLMDYFASLGLKKVFFVPGGGNMFLVDAIGRHPEIDFVSTHNEQAAVIAAEAYTRLTNSIGIALVTTGPGATNSITGIAGAWLDSIPLIVISGQVKRNDIKKNSGVRQKGPQEIDIVSMVKNITKYAKTIKNKNNILNEVQKSISLTISGRPGPILLDIPLDIQASEKVFKKFKKQSLNSLRLKSKNINQLQLKKIIDKIRESKKPLFLLGQGIKSAQAITITKKLVEKFNIPYLVTWPMLDFAPDCHKLNMGRPGVVAKRYPNLILQNCDLLISIGARLDRVVTAHNPKNFAKNANLYCIDVDISELEKHPKRFNVIHSDAKNFISNLLNKCEPKPKNNLWVKECNLIKNYFITDKIKKSRKLSIYEVIDLLSKKLPRDSIIATGSSGLSIEAFYTHFSNKENQRIFLTTGLGAMGYGFPALVGVNKLNKQLFLYESDGSAMMNLQELQTLKTIGSKAKIFLINNNGYASIRNTQRNFFKGRYIGTGSNSGLDTPSISKLSCSLGIKSFKCKSLKELESKLDKYLIKDELILFEIFVQENENLFPKCSTHNTDNGNFISAPIEDMSPLLPLITLKKFTNNKLDKLSERIRNEI